MLVHPRKRTKHGRRDPRPQRPEASAATGCEGSETRSRGESEPHVRRASESPSVCVCRINSDEQSVKRYARSGAGQPLALEHRDKPGASSCQQETPENSEVMRSEPEHQRGRTNMTERHHLLEWPGRDRRPAPQASCTCGALAPAPRTGSLGLPSILQN